MILEIKVNTFYKVVYFVYTFKVEKAQKQTQCSNLAREVCFCVALSSNSRHWQTLASISSPDQYVNFKCSRLFYFSSNYFSADSSYIFHSARKRLSFLLRYGNIAKGITNWDGFFITHPDNIRILWNSENLRLHIAAFSEISLDLIGPISSII